MTLPLRLTPLLLVCSLACSSKFTLTEDDPEEAGDGADGGFDGASDGSDGAGDGADGAGDGADGAGDGADGGDGTAVDADGDGWPVDEDCDDDDPARFPGAVEECNGIDDDCDDDIDEGVTSTFYADGDSDGYGRDADTVEACAAPAGHAAVGGDCDDTEAAVNPGANEVCDGLDNDCNGGIDEGLAATFYVDSDGDGFGSSASSVEACTQPSGYASNDADCDDGAAAAFPGGTESCDGLDNDCNGSVDDGVGSTWYTDSDGDGYGASGTGQQACTQPSGAVADDTDCNDTAPDISPAATELCDGIDNDCDATTSETGTVSFTDASGAVTAATSTFSGSSSSPAAPTLTSDGTVTFCDGTYYVNIDVQADVTLTSALGAAVTVLDGAATGSVVNVETDGVSLTVTDLELTNGDGSGVAFGQAGTGGGVNCDAASVLSMTDVVLSANTATDGGGLASDGCTVTLDTVEVSDNTATYGAGIDLGNGSGVFTDVSLIDNVASSTGGGMYLSTDTSSASVSWSGGSATGNAAGYGAAFMLDGTDHNASLSLSNVEVSGNASSNATVGGAALVYTDADLAVANGAWGTSAGGDDNSGVDVTTYGTASNDYADYGDDTWFECDESGCDTFVYDDVAGAALFLYGDSATTGSLSCDLYYAVTGTGTSSVCDDCAFALDLDLAYDATLSTNDGSCSTSDAAWVIGYAPNPSGYTSPVAYYQYASSWYAAFYADFDGEYLSFGGGYYEYWDGSSYYTNYTYATMIPE